MNSSSKPPAGPKLSISPSLDSDPDRLFAGNAWPRPFEFNDQVAQVFDDMVSRSVPQYLSVVTATAQWALRFAPAAGRIVDIGCSTATQLELIARISPQPLQLIGIDNSKPMLEKAQGKIGKLLKSEDAPSSQFEFWCGDALDYKYQNLSVAIANYTLQFIPVAQRRLLLQKLATALQPGGLLIISEKVRPHCLEFQECFTHLYENFKERSGYSKNEIERKKEALENVLISLTDTEQVAMLHDCGFDEVQSILRWHNFTTYVALKR